MRETKNADREEARNEGRQTKERKTKKAEKSETENGTKNTEKTKAEDIRRSLHSALI
jgi:hypothetical protein